ncbi:MAG: bifunctional 5,10-methylenetetrahydrofolate dehydrogenase/5,10-methenyltetrahydrofolate cyclohydrolase [Candidatus Yanofskybacteria bacterium]|nr:bifunctional 5,10-methylenetetrahydrofolate dehydrogenase/5,10-methenyltetrahydrofolate cyclohydrolase [Candidatus Yanofskybacteria bacterium]
MVSIAKAGVNHGVLIELPLPAHINTQYILNAIPQEKDVDVLSERAQGTFFARLEAKLLGVGRSLILPPAVEAVKTIFKKYDINLKGKKCAIFGYGLLVGKPISHWLASQGATVSIINEFTPNPAELSRHADIIVAGTGQEGLIAEEMVKEEAVVIDFGKDVDFEPIAKKASLITPPIGGVGPIVIAAVLKNLLALCKIQEK